MHDGVGGYADLQKTLRRATKPTVYWNVGQNLAGIFVQYWFMYLLDDWKNWHEGDLEQITIRLTPDGAVPCEVGYSEHDSGLRRYWNAVETLRGRDHPLVYVARGSHANYFSLSRPRVYVPIGKRKKVFIGHDVANRARRKRLKPGEYRLVRLDSLPAFRGDYGFGNFSKPVTARVPGFGRRIPLNVPLNFSATVTDPRRRPEWHHPGNWIFELEADRLPGVPAC